MPLDFFVLGVFVLTLFCVMSHSKRGLIISFLGVVLVMISYFVREVQLGNVVFNWLFFCGLVLVVIGLNLKKKYQVNTIFVPLSLACVYLLLNIVNLEYNMFFTIIPICVAGVLGGFLCAGSVENRISGVILTLAICEIVNLFVMVKHLGFLALFGCDLRVCIVLCVLPYFLGFLFCEFVKIVKSLLNNKKMVSK